MVEYTREKVLPEDLIQKTNLQQHNFMIDAINDIDERQGNIEDVTNVNIDDIAVLKTGVVALSNEKLDKADINEDLHFGDISVTRDGTAVIMSLDVLNPSTGVVTPISFTIPGATSTEAGTMDASSVAWIADAEERISVLEGLSDVKAVADLTGAPTQAQLTAGWVAVAGKQPETGDILQDINNSKLWVFVGTDWVLYGTIVTVPLATTSTIGGVRDTSLTAPGNRWYVHVEADGRLSLIGGDALSTLIDTTIPALQAGVNNAVKKTGNETIVGLKIFADRLETNAGVVRVNASGYLTYGDFDVRSTGDDKCQASIILKRMVGGTSKRTDVVKFIVDGDNVYTSAPMRSSPGSSDVVNKGYLDSRLTSKQDTLTFDSAPVAGSDNPVKSGGVYNALATKANVGGTIDTGGIVNWRPAIANNSWLQCVNPNVSNFVNALVSRKNITIEISLDGGLNSSFVCIKEDTLNSIDPTSYSFLVPKNWWYRVVFNPGETCNIVEQQLIL